MKILLIGFISFLAWTGLSSYLYVCEVKSLCENCADCPTNTERTAIVPIPQAENPEAVSTEEVPEVEKTAIAREAIGAPPSLKSPGNGALYFEKGLEDFLETDEAIGYFQQLTQYLQAVPGQQVVITGHTCNDGNPPLNQKLGLARAMAVKDALVQKGIPAERIQVQSEGERKPIASNDTEPGKRKNRRAEISLPN
jgi:outer membrane protein OmpA-like peptidoglycan-associated protein